MGVSQVGKINDEMRIQPYPFPIEEGVSLMSEASSASPSSRSSLRRMRTETFTFPTMTESPQIEAIDRSIKLYEDLNLALKERRYQEGIRLIEEFEADWNDHMCDELIQVLESREFQVVGMRPFVIHFVGSLIDIQKACLQGLEKNEQALLNLEEGFRKLTIGVDKLLDIMEALGYPSLERVEASQYILAAQLFSRGLIQFSLGAQREAVNDLRAFYLEYAQTEMGKECGISIEFLLRVMEELTEEEILPTNPSLDEKNIASLFLQKRYEEAFEIAETEDDMKVCLAMLGRYEEAHAIDSPNCNDSIKGLIELKRGNIAYAKELILSGGLFSISSHLILQGLERS